MTEKEQQDIYSILRSRYEPGQPFPLDRADDLLHQHDIVPQMLGFWCCRVMLEEMGNYLTVTGSAGGYRVTLLDKPYTPPDPPKAQPEPAPVPMAAPQSPSVKQLTAEVKGTLISLLHGHYDDWTAPITIASACSFLGQQGYKAVDFGLAKGTDLIRALAPEVVVYSALLREGDAGSRVDYLRFADQPQPQIATKSDSEAAPLDSTPAGQQFVRWAHISNPPAMLKQLAELAEPEPWGFGETPDDYSILWAYLTYTFYRLRQEGKVYIDPAGQFAAFNTGLLSRSFGRDIYAFFRPAPGQAKQDWNFVCFCSSTNEAKTDTQRKAIALLVPLDLQLPTYFTDLYDTMYDPNSPLEINFMHIVRDNLIRFPLSWVHRQCDDYPRTLDIMDEIDAEYRVWENASNVLERTASHLRLKEIFARLGEAITDPDDPEMLTLLSDMNTLFEGAVQRAIRMCRRNFKLAVPFFFPTRNTMSILLPISFSRINSGIPDMVLVAERQPNGAYLGRTVLTMRMAYLDARLLCRPSSEWLTAANVGDSPSDDAAEEL